MRDEEPAVQLPRVVSVEVTHGASHPLNVLVFHWTFSFVWGGVGPAFCLDGPMASRCATSDRVKKYCRPPSIVGPVIGCTAVVASSAFDDVPSARLTSVAAT